MFDNFYIDVILLPYLLDIDLLLCILFSDSKKEQPVSSVRGWL